MKKLLVVSVGAVLMLSSCGTYAGAGAYTGGTFGSIIGSAIGGITGGPRGSDIGTLIGMAGGAVVGAAVGSAADRVEQQRYEEYRQQRQQRIYENTSRNAGRERTTEVGDDRLYGFDEDFHSTVSETSHAAIEIRNPRIVDASRDGVLSRGEEAHMVFEVFNISSNPVFAVRPSVSEVTGNRHIRVSENVLVECIKPGKGIRYTAVVRTDDHLRDGEAVFRIGVMQGNKEIAAQTKEFRIMTSRR